ncbi:insulinase family protein [Rheinheimera sp. MMS21-TC3]|uniref:insulinase family protein n=1 Tax=Rheinheimera sp. MMS21-TC3 TaxID=3072790 RepID=UPI0028C396C9|nr:insulinase family protein [Rheinheimera sp. MMS21-TC3]WNO59956.1 insulinase family protein [Rheinheimera sp. MMS21-TC3]
MKKILMVSAVALAVLAGCATEQSATDRQNSQFQQQQVDVITSPNDQRAYKVLTLNNKLEVMLVSDPTAEKSAAALSVGVGILQDPMSQQGMAHYLEHMLFLGTERYPDTKGYSEFMTKHGGAQNAYTWLDITNYMFKVNNDVYDEALDRFSDFFKAPMLYPEYTDKEKNAVNAEWSMRREMDFFGQYNLARSMMGDHTANRFLIGNLETLGDKKHSQLHAETVEFYNKYYSANIMKVALISNLPLAEMEKLAQKHFASIKNKNITKPSVTDKLDFSQFAGKRIHYVPNADVKQLRIDFTIDNNADQYAVKPNEFISYLLGSEMPGSPAQKLKEMGLISGLNVSTSAEAYGNYGSLSVDINLTDMGMQNREGIVAVIMQYIDLIKREGVDSKYFSEIQTSLNNRFRFLEKSDEFSYVSSLTDAMQKVPAKHAINANYYYQKFDAAAVHQVLQQLTPERLRIWYISKQEPSDSELHFYDGKYKIVDISAEEQQSWKHAESLALALPSVNRLLPENFAIKQNAEQDKPKLEVEQNAIKAWLYPSQQFSHQPKGTLTLLVNSNSGQLGVNARVMLALWRDLYNLEQSALATEASIAGMYMGLSEANGLILTVSGFTDKQPELVKQALAGLAVNVDLQSFNQALDRFIRGVQNQSKQFPYSQAFNAYNKLIRSDNYESEALVTAAKNISLAQLQQFMQQTLKHNQLRLFAFGNYDSADLQQVVTEVNKALPEERVSQPYHATTYWQPQPGQTLVIQRDIDVADVALVDVHVHPEPSYRQLASATVLSSHFSNIAFDKLRTEEQLAYAVGGTATKIDNYVGFAMYIQTPVKNVVDMQARFDSFKQQYAIELKALTEEQFDQFKASTLITLKQPAKNLQQEVGPFLTDWYQEKFDFDSKQKLITAVEQLSLADVKDFYQQTMLNPDAARISVQMRGTKFQQQPFANLPKQTLVTDIAEFQRTMPKQ